MVILSILNIAQNFIYLFITKNSELLEGFHKELKEKYLAYISSYIKNNKNYGFSYKIALQKKVSGRNYAHSTHLKAAYFSWSQVRWVHSERVITNTVWHSLTSEFATTIWQKVALYMNSYKFYPGLIIKEKEEKNSSEKIIYPNDIYKTWIPDNSITNIREFLEYNTITNFVPLKALGAKIMLYDANTCIDVKSQPDVLIQLASNNNLNHFLDQRILGIDKKDMSFVGIGNCNILSGVTIAQYERTIEYFKKELIHHQLYNEEIKFSLELLVNSCHDLDIHQIIWSSQLHHFTKLIPPLRVPHDFTYGDVREEFIVKVLDAKIFLQIISDHLFEKKYLPRTRGYIIEETRRRLAYDEKITYYKKLGALLQDWTDILLPGQK